MYNTVGNSYAHKSTIKMCIDVIARAKIRICSSVAGYSYHVERGKPVAQSKLKSQASGSGLNQDREIPFHSEVVTLFHALTKPYWSPLPVITSAGRSPIFQDPGSLLN